MIFASLFIYILKIGDCASTEFAISSGRLLSFVMARPFKRLIHPENGTEIIEGCASSASAVTIWESGEAI